MSTRDIKDSELLAVKNGLLQLGDAIETIANRELPAPEIPNRSLSGDKIQGGKIAQFSSAGIRDEAMKQTLVVKDEGIYVDNIDVATLVGDTTIENDLTVGGTITATRLEVDELKADVRNERTSPLEFACSVEDMPYGKGLLWTGVDHTKQLVMQGNPDRIWSSEDFDLHTGHEYKIGNVTVLSANELGPDITKSSLTEVGILRNLKTEGSLTIDQFIFYNGDEMRFGIGTELGNGQLSVSSNEVEFIVDFPEYDSANVGTYTTSDVNLISDNQTRVKIKANNRIEVGSDTDSITTVKGKLGVGVNNPDVCFSTSGPIKFENKKFEIGVEAPENGIYVKGDIVWNSEPRPTGYIGWVCIKNGTPGDWKPFGVIEG